MIFGKIHLSYHLPRRHSSDSLLINDRVSNNVQWVFFHNLKASRTDLCNVLPQYWYSWPLKSKCMHNFPPHHSCIATPPKTALATKQHVVFLWVGGSEQIMDDGINWWPTNFSIPWNFNYWLAWLRRTFLTEHTTRSHSLLFLIMICRSCQLNQCLSYFGSLRSLRSF